MKRTSDNNDIPLINKILPGLIALIILLLIWGPNEFFPWLSEILIVYLAWFFLLRVIVKTIISQKYDPSFTPTLIIGVLALVASAVIFGDTPYDIMIKLLRATVIWSAIYTSFGWFKETVYKRRKQ